MGGLLMRIIILRKYAGSSRKAFVLHLLSFATSSENPRFSQLLMSSSRKVYSVIEDMTKGASSLG